VGDCGAVLYIKQSSKLAPGAWGAVTATKLVGIINVLQTLFSKHGFESLLHMIHCMPLDINLKHKVTAHFIALNVFQYHKAFYSKIKFSEST
jgi:hypothetical protein